jgi:L-rhamnose mutarotase
MCLRLKPGAVADYRRLHAAVWPDVLARITASHITDYSIFLKEPDNILFAVWRYHGADFAADMAAMAEDAATQAWWQLCVPLQEPFEHREPGAWWAMMEEVFHLD